MRSFHYCLLAFVSLAIKPKNTLLLMHYKSFHIYFLRNVHCLPWADHCCVSPVPLPHVTSCSLFPNECWTFPFWCFTVSWTQRSWGWILIPLTSRGLVFLFHGVVTLPVTQVWRSGPVSQSSQWPNKCSWIFPHKGFLCSFFLPASAILVYPFQSHP